MASEPGDTLSKTSTAIYLYAVSAYLVVMGLLYQWGFWGPFNINILEYLGLADMVKPAALPLAPALLPFLVGLLMAHVGSTKGSLPPGGGRNTATGKFLRRYAGLLSALYVVTVLVLMSLGLPRFWQVLPFLIALPVALSLSHFTTLFSQVSDPNARYVVLLALSIALPMSFGQGRLRAQAILTGERYDAVYSTVEGFDVAPNAKPSERLRFLGYAGEHLFYFDPVNGGIAMEREGNKKPPIRLQTYKDSMPVIAGQTSASAASSPASGPPAAPSVTSPSAPAIRVSAPSAVSAAASKASQ